MWIDAVCTLPRTSTGIRGSRNQVGLQDEGMNTSPIISCPNDRELYFGGCTKGREGFGVGLLNVCVCIILS